MNGWDVFAKLLEILEKSSTADDAEDLEYQDHQGDGLNLYPYCRANSLNSGRHCRRDSEH